MSAYNDVIQVLALYIGLAVPVTIFCGLAGKTVNAMLDMVTGKERIRL